MLAASRALRPARCQPQGCPAAPVRSSPYLRPASALTGSLATSLQRGENFFCEKVINCMASGGRGAVIFNRDDQPACQLLQGATLLYACTPEPESFIPVLGLTRAQGQALKALVLKGGVVNATLEIPEVRRRPGGAGGPGRTWLALSCSCLRFQEQAGPGAARAGG
jgi:hypothetical protein